QCPPTVRESLAIVGRYALRPARASPERTARQLLITVCRRANLTSNLERESRCEGRGGGGQMTMTQRFELPGFNGALIQPGDDAYDDARKLFNGMIDRRPALIARCTNADDVVAAVNLAREQQLPLAVHGGGHGVNGAAMCDDGVVVDLRGMKRIAVDVDARQVRAEAGSTWGE